MRYHDKLYSIVMRYCILNFLSRPILLFIFDGGTQNHMLLSFKFAYQPDFCTFFFYDDTATNLDYEYHKVTLVLKENN